MATTVWLFERVTCASDSAAPEVSFTVPVTPPVATCANSGGMANNANNKLHAIDNMQI